MGKIIVLIAAFIVIISYTLTSCATSKPTGLSSVHGLWMGTYVIDGGQTPNRDTYYSFIIKPGGSLLVETRFLNQQQFAVGTWTLSGKNLSCVFTYVNTHVGHEGTVQSATAIWDNSGKLNSGIWANSTPKNGVTGTFNLTKVN